MLGIRRINKLPGLLPSRVPQLCLVAALPLPAGALEPRAGFYCPPNPGLEVSAPRVTLPGVSERIRVLTGLCTSVTALGWEAAPPRGANGSVLSHHSKEHSSGEIKEK